MAGRLSLAVTYDLWLGSWETALSALATATESRTLDATEIATHRAVIADERELVTILLGRTSEMTESRRGGLRPSRLTQAVR
ncbi:MAG TPA: hypothetical protein VF063_07570 [Gaiellaceae bacterium]